MMKRRDLLALITRHARALNLEISLSEAGSHTKVTVGHKRTVVPRHSEINDRTARAILGQLGIER